MYGLSDNEFDEMIAIFSKCKNLEKVILYGSRAKGNYKKFSDVGITLVGEKFTLKDLSQIQDLLYESDLPRTFNCGSQLSASLHLKKM